MADVDYKCRKAIQSSLFVLTSNKKKDQAINGYEFQFCAKISESHWQITNELQTIVEQINYL